MLTLYKTCSFQANIIFAHFGLTSDVIMGGTDMDGFQQYISIAFKYYLLNLVNWLQ